MSNEKTAAAPTRMVAKKTAGSMAIVRCKNFRCLATKGPDGVWRDAHKNALVVLEIVAELP